MKLHPTELKKVKHPEKFVYKVYELFPDIATANPYSGKSLISAKNAEEANKQIREFKKQDKNNNEDSFGYPYVTENDWTGEYSDQEFLDKGIYYTG